MKMKLFSLFLLLLALTTSKLSAEDYFLISDNGTSARMIGIGNIQGFDNTAAVIFENPAGLYQVEKFSIANFTR